jgi:hypothetical protein
VDDLIPAAQSLIRSLCHDKDGWEYSATDELAADPWGADRILAFRRADYVLCYVGFRGSTPLYVLQRIE